MTVVLLPIMSLQKNRAIEEKKPGQQARAILQGAGRCNHPRAGLM
ncbi:hypothetical protein [Ideonella sp. B508-1]|nr:hypothetical protein [Ideonella sp. B508-1]